jgi:ribonuclease R
VNEKSSLLAEYEGVVSGHRDGHGFVIRDDGQADIYLPSNEMRAVLHKDRVKARIVRLDRKGRPEGRVTEIVERTDSPIIGRLLQESGVWLVAPEDKRYGQDVLIPKGATGSAKPGQVVVVQLTEPPALYGQPVGRVKEVLGEIDDPGMEIEIAVRKYGVPHEFSDAALAQARALPDHVRANDHKQRVDLRDVPLGDHRRRRRARLRRRGVLRAGQGRQGQGMASAGGNRRREPLRGDRFADRHRRLRSRDRGVFPAPCHSMLPEKLSNGLCSLNPGVERLCIVCDMLVNAKGEVHAYQFYPAVMFSHARFTYTEVAAILQNTRGPEASQRKGLVPYLLNLHDVYRALLTARGERGAVDFETTETQIVCDESGRIEKIIPRTRNDAHNAD